MRTTPSLADVVRSPSMTATIDVTRTWAKVEERLATETDPILRRNLETVLAHMKAEAAGDLDGLMATVSESASYHAYGAPPEQSPQGKGAVRTFYENFIASSATKLELDGVMKMAWPGSTLQARGIEVDDPDAFYLYETRMATLWPLDDEGLVIGEDTYTGGNGFDGIAGRKVA